MVLTVTPTSRTLLLTTAALVAFAANSLLCRLALGLGLIDAASFTTIRVVSGAMALGLIVLLTGHARRDAAVDWRSGLMLFAYMACFSFAYRSLSAGTGALVLFGTVQLTMFAVALQRGETFPPLSWAGLAIAAAGLIYLVLPGVTAPDLPGALLMAGAGIAWGCYSLLGRSAVDPLAASMRNFLLCVPLVLIVSLVFWPEHQATAAGVLLAMVSGAIASGCGYVVWYAALPGLSATRAATVQLAVPVIAALGGVALLAEPLTSRLILASIATLGGVALALLQRSTQPIR